MAETSGRWSVAVLVNSGDVNYDILVDTTTDFELPEPLADFEFSSSGSPDDGRFQSFRFDVNAGELVVARITWDDPNAGVRVFLRDENNTQIERDIDGSGSAFLSAVAESSGRWSVAVQVNSGDVNYDVLVDTTTDFVLPEPLADFEFSSSGSPDDGRFQTFPFDVNAGELVEARITWDDPNADVRVFLRDENNTQIERITDGSGSAMLSTVAQTSGRWSVAVQVNSGNVNYNVLVDTTGEATDNVVEINTQPVAVTVIEGGTASFSVTASGNGTLSYQWFANGVAIAGANASTFTVGPVILVDSGMIFSVTVSDDNGSISSDNAILTVEAMPVVTNIALNGIASQSSTSSGGVPNRAIDGNTNGVYSNNSVTHTASSSQPWWEVQLSGLSTIETIVIYNRTDCCRDRLSNYTVSILNGAGEIVFSRVFAETPNPINSIDIGGVVGSAVRVQLNGSGNPLSLAEVQVMGYAQ